MKHSFLPRLRASRLLVVALALMVISPFQGFADELLTPRRTLGVALLGGSLLLAKNGLDLHRDADDLYDRYKKADRAEEAGRLYRRTNNRDIKSQVSFALSAAFAISGVRLLLRGKSDAEQSPSRGWALAGPGAAGRFDLRLTRSWRFL